jgi:phytoene dehydrogenase-like protein
MGAFALDVYHEGAFYVEGELFILARKLQSFIEHHGGEVKLYCKAIHVEKRGALFTVEDEYKQRYKAEYVVSNLPLGQLLRLLEERIVQNLSPKIKERQGTVGGVYDVFCPRRKGDPFRFTSFSTSFNRERSC